MNIFSNSFKMKVAKQYIFFVPRVIIIVCQC